MAYIPLGSRFLTAAADTTGLNSGNWTNQFTPAVLATKVSYYEIYSMSVTGVPALATVTVYVNGRVRSSALLGGNSEWDPAQPILLIPGDEVDLAWNLAASGAAPVATVWLRYDPSIQPGGS